MQRTYIKNHCRKHDESEPCIKLRNKINDRNNDVHDSRRNREQNVREKIVYGVCSSVHYPKDLSRFSGQMPTEGQVVKMSE